MNSSNKSQVGILAWNMRSLSGAKHYINDIIDKGDKSADFICVSEHRLFECELFKLDDINADYFCHAKASKDLLSKNQSVMRGHCGVAILWKRSLGHCVKVIDIQSDRICCVEMVNVICQKSLFIISVYLPQQGCKIACYKDEVEI